MREPPEFTWSVTAWQCFSRCPRAYCFRYPGAWGGADQYAPEALRARHRIKRRSRIGQWADQVFREGLREWLETVWRNPAKARKELLRANLLRRLTAGWREALASTHHDDPRQTAFHEWAQDGVPETAAAHFCEIRDRLLERLEQLGQSRTLAEIVGLNYLEVRDCRTPTAFPLAGIKVWSAPLLGWRRDGLIHLAYFHPGDRAAHPHWAWQAGVGTHLGRHLATRAGLDPERAVVVRSIFAGEPTPGGLTVYGGRHHQEVAALVASTAPAMAKGPDPADYPVTTDPKRCAACEFRSLCPAR